MAAPLAPPIAICSTCGEPLNGNGCCVVCLLRGGLDESVPETETAASLVFGDFEVEQRADGFCWELGHGAMGVTYLAMDKVLRRRVALKVIDVPEAARGSQAVRDRFFREARAAAALRHPNVAAVFQFGASPDATHCYYAMELVEGETLEARVRRDGPLNAGPALEIAIQITRALIAAAAQGVIHRDLKPGNVMLTSANAATTGLDVKVIDFGLAKALADAGGDMDLTHDGFVGTPTFASPEQFGGGPVDARADIYSLGATLWFALTGQTPRSGSTIEEIRNRQTHDNLPVEQLVARKVPAPLINLLRSTLAVDPSKRPASARELMEALESCRRKLSHHIGVSYKLAALILVAAVAAAAFFMFQVNRQNLTATPGRDIAPSASALTLLPEKSIAVLPFENRSEDKANAYFADGVQDEILTRLSKIADLKVIPRTSTQHYKSAPKNLPEIARQLGVAHILKGSVQKSGDAVRVNVQLINAANDSQLWADTFDRKLTDIFSVESEVAKAIADQLRAKLTGQEEQIISAKPTDNVEAYDAYLRGLAFEARGWYSIPPLWKSITFYERAVELDPNFALAWARLSRVNANIYSIGGDTHGTPAARGDAAKRALENAQKLEPNSPETLLALGYYQYWVLRDYGRAKTAFERVSKMLPGSSEVPKALGRVTRREGNWDQSIGYLEQALALDPRNLELLMDAAWTHDMLRQFPAALKLYDRALDMTPNDPVVMATKASIYHAQGNLQEAARSLSEINEQAPDGDTLAIKINQLRYERNYGEAVRLLQTRLAQFHFESDYDKAWDQVLLALTQRLAGDTAGAKVTAEQARNTLEPLYRDQPDDSSLAALLSKAYAAMGEKDSALKAAERAIMLNPRAKDAVTGPTFEENLAFIQATFGENSRAISTLTQLLQKRYNGGLYGLTPITPALLRLDPIWDPLRNDPRFQELIAEKKLLPEKSIAVLPLENMSNEKEDALFADGIQDELLSNLSKIKELKVISRTSVMQYKSGITLTLKEIAQQLGVNNVVEGSVRRSGNHVRVSVQLIDAKTDSHIWGRNFDRTLADSLTLQGELATEIAAAVGATLSPQEKARVTAKPTNNVAAYDAYLRGRVFANEETNMEKALRSYEKAAELDPNFALAWARLSSMQSQAYWQLDSNPERVAAAKAAIDRALALDPSLPEVHLALGYYRYYVQRDFTGALTELRQAEQALPNDTDVIKTSAFIQRRRGQWDEALAGLQRAVELDPRDIDGYNNLALTYEALRRFPEALATFDRASTWEPVNLDCNCGWDSLLRMRADVLLSMGNLQDVEAPAHESIHTIGFIRVAQPLLQRRYAEAKDILSKALADESISRKQYGEEREILLLLLGLTQQRAGDIAAARGTYQQVVQDSRRTLDTVSPGSSGETEAHANLGWAYAGLREAGPAIAEGRKAMAIMPSSKDAYRGPKYEENMARIYALLGDADHAIPILERLLHIPYSAAATPAKLRIDPTLERIRNDPRFQELIAEKTP